MLNDVLCNSRGIQKWLLPPANEVWGKVIFLHLSVILFIGGSASVHAGRPLYQGGPPGDPPAKETPCQGGPPAKETPPARETSPCQGGPLPGRPPCQGAPPAKKTPPAKEAPCQGDPLPKKAPYQGDPQGDPPAKKPPSRPTPKGETEGDQVQAHIQGGN